MQRQPSPHVSPQQSRSRIEDSFSLEIDPSATNTVGPDFPPAQGLLGHTVYTKVWMGGYSQRGPKKTANEDRFFAIPDLNAYGDAISLTQPKIAFAGVFDGHGGALAADFCNSRLPVLASKNPHLDDLDKDLANILAATMQDIVDEMEEDLRDCCDQYNDTSGACAALVLFRGGRLCVANIGDCQVYACDDLGKIHCVSVVHRCSNPAEVERLQKAQAPIRGDRVLGVLEPTRSFGDFDIKSQNPLSVIHTPFMLTAIVRKAKSMTTRPLLEQQQLAALQTSAEPGSRRTESKPLGRRRRSLSFLTRPLARSNVPKRSPSPSPRQEEHVDDSGREAACGSSQPSSASFPTLKKTESWYARAKKSTEGGARGVNRLLSITKPGLKRNHSTSTLKAMLNKSQT
jgi:serine/threonine protein phosphatase PrpC